MKTERDDAGRGTRRASLNDEAERRAPQAMAWPGVGIIGAGAVGTALGVAISRAGWPVVAVASRDADRRERFCALVPGVRAFIEPAAVLDHAGLVILAVPDHAIAGIATQIKLRSGQALVHTSGALGAEVLGPAVAAEGTFAGLGAFHPLVSFTSDVERSVESLEGATFALDGDERLTELLADLVVAIGGTPLRLPRGSKAAYHAAAVLASGGLVALLDAIVTLGATAGLDERGSLAVYGRLMEQTLANARASGVAASLTGPVTRGDVGTIAAHIAVLESNAPGVVELYRALSRRQLRIVEERGSLAPNQVAAVRDVLAKGA